MLEIKLQAIRLSNEENALSVNANVILYHGEDVLLDEYGNLYWIYSEVRSALTLPVVYDAHRELLFFDQANLSVAFCRESCTYRIVSGVHGQELVTFDIGDARKLIEYCDSVMKEVFVPLRQKMLEEYRSTQSYMLFDILSIIGDKTIRSLMIR